MTIGSASTAGERRLSPTAIGLGMLALISLPLLHLSNRLSVRRTLAAVAILGRPSWSCLTFDPAMVGRAVNYASRISRLQDTTCVARSQLVWLLLSIGGQQPVIRVGAGTGLGTRSLAHAWVELHDVPVADAADVAVQHPPFDRPLLGMTE